jgi:DNA-binding MltR family transcriptional regulator
MEESGQETTVQGSDEIPSLKQMADERFREVLIAVRDAVPELQSTSSDRACVLVSVSLIDTALEKLLRTKFSVSSQVTQKECDFLLIKKPVPPLGSAGIRARLAFALGLIDRDTLNAISYAIERRNEYAHQLKPPPLTARTVQTFRGLFSVDHRRRLEELEKTAFEDYENAGKPLPADPETIEQLTRHTFGRLCLDMCLELNFQAILVELDPIHEAMIRAQTSPQSEHRPMP